MQPDATLNVADRPAEFDKRLMDNYKLIRWHARRFSRDPERQEELIQETVARALTKWQSFREDGVFESWLYYLMLQIVSIDKEKKRPDTSGDPNALERITIAPEQEYATDIAAVMKTIEGSAVLSMVAYGHRYAEIARMKGVTRSAICQEADRERARLFGGEFRAADRRRKQARKNRYDKMKADLAAKEVA